MLKTIPGEEDNQDEMKDNQNLKKQLLIIKQKMNSYAKEITASCL